MRYGPTDPSYWGPNGEMPAHVQALAEACEYAARRYETDAQGAHRRRNYSLRDKLTKLAKQLYAHARALREGRVTVNEGGTDA